MTQDKNSTKAINSFMAAIVRLILLPSLGYGPLSILLTPNFYSNVYLFKRMRMWVC